MQVHCDCKKECNYLSYSCSISFATLKIQEMNQADQIEHVVTCMPKNKKAVTLMLYSYSETLFRL